MCQGLGVYPSEEGAGLDEGDLVVGPRILALASAEAVTLFVFSPTKCRSSCSTSWLWQNFDVNF